MSRKVRGLGGLALFVLVFCMVGMAGMASPAAAERYQVGTLGATIPGDDWERRTINKDLGPDQFLRADRNYFMVVLETFDLYEVRSDFVDKLDAFAAGISGSKPDPELGYARHDGVTRATRRFAASSAGLDFRYQIDLISAGDGLGYVFLSWSVKSAGEGLEQQMEATLAGFELPGPESEWAKKATPSRHELEFAGRTVELTYRDSVFEEGSSRAGQRYSLNAGNGSLSVHLLLDELGGDADSALDQVLTIATQGEDYEELARSDVERGGPGSDLAPGRQALLRRDGDPPIDLAVAVIDAGDGDWVDLRMVSTGSTGHREGLWNRLLASVRVTTPDDLDAYPVVSTPPEAESTYLAPGARRLLEESHLLGTVSAPVSAVVGDGDLLVRDGRRVTLVSPAPAGEGEPGSTRVLYESDDYFGGTLVPWGEWVLLVRDGEDLSVITDGELEPASFKADVVAPAGPADVDLLLARNGKSTELVGFGDLPSVGLSLIVARGDGGKERILFGLEDQDVTALARRSTGEVLSAATVRTVLSAAEEGPPVHLYLVSRGHREPEEIGRWQRIDRLEPGPDGWLVTGAPAEGGPGVYRVSDDGTTELLLSGSPTGLVLTDTELTFSSAKCLEPSEDTYRFCVYRADLDLVRELGRTFQPFTTEIVNRIAARVWPDLDGNPADVFPATRQAIADTVATADEVARELAGVELPVAGAGVDDLLGSMTYDSEVSDGGVLLLSVVLSESLLRDGAAWEPAGEARRSTGAAHDAGSWEAENAFAVGLHPLTVVVSTLYEEDGWYRPVETIADRAAGRTIVLGLDPDAVAARVRAEVIPGLEEPLRAARVEPLAAALAARPENVHLRQVVYEQLAAGGHQAELAELAGRFAARDDARGEDLVAWMAARLAAEPSPEETSAAIADLRAAIERAPDEAGLYLLLGAAYERTSDADDPGRSRKLAQACYRKARDTVAWGPLRSQADEALARLEVDR